MHVKRRLGSTFTLAAFVTLLPSLPTTQAGKGPPSTRVAGVSNIKIDNVGQVNANYISLFACTVRVQSATESTRSRSPPSTGQASCRLGRLAGDARLRRESQARRDRHSAASEVRRHHVQPGPMRHLTTDDGPRGYSAVTSGTRRSCSTCRSHPPSWFQLTKVRLTTISPGACDDLRPGRMIDRARDRGTPVPESGQLVRSRLTSFSQRSPGREASSVT